MAPVASSQFYWQSEREEAQGIHVLCLTLLFRPSILDDNLFLCLIFEAYVKFNGKRGLQRVAILTLVHAGAVKCLGLAYSHPVLLVLSLQNTCKTDDEQSSKSSL